MRAGLPYEGSHQPRDCKGGGGIVRPVCDAPAGPAWFSHDVVSAMNLREAEPLVRLCGSKGHESTALRRGLVPERKHFHGVLVHEKAGRTLWDGAQQLQSEAIVKGAKTPFCMYRSDSLRDTPMAALHLCCACESRRGAMVSAVEHSTRL